MSPSLHRYAQRLSALYRSRSLWTKRALVGYKNSSLAIELWLSDDIVSCIQKGSRDITEERFQLIKPFTSISSSAVIQLQSIKQLDDPVKMQLKLSYKQSWRVTIEVGRVTALMGLQIVDVDAFSQRMTLTVVADAGIKVGFRKFLPASVLILNSSSIPGMSRSIVMQGQRASLQALLSELLVEGASPGTGNVLFTIDDGGGTGISNLPSLNSTFSLQV